MAILEARSSSDAALASRGEYYDVFLNFRGEDTRHGFTDFLYHALVDAGVYVFRDEEKLPVGEVISEKLQQAINNTTIYIPIFSQTYASSKWCLRELTLMVDNVSKSKGQKSVIPIFFLVEPDDVKLKKPLYKADFKKHEKNFRHEVEAWKGALGKVDEHKGRVVKKDQSQAEMVKLLVKEVLEKLKSRQKLVTENLVGLDDRIKELTELLDVNHDDVRFIGIYGMGGIGKTTIAKAVFNELCSDFGKCCSFLEGVREKSSTNEGIVALQKNLLSDIGSFGLAENINDRDEAMRMIRLQLNEKKVLVVLDDVDKKEHIKNLIGDSNLNRGSRIIITTRDRNILQVEGSEVKIEWYERPMMDDGLALQLFCRHAFRKDYPPDDYRELSRQVVSLTGGLPLAIEVVGSSLEGKKDKKIWEDTLDKLKKVPQKEIVERLRISYNGLDEFQKKIFLDIACFFFHEKKTDAIYMWDSCKYYPIEGIEVLTNKCLIKILDDGTFWMHDQLRALGRQIVREDNQGDLQKQSRLWTVEQANKIKKIEERKQMVEALEISEPITNEEFERLPNLTCLYLNKGTFDGDFARCHSNLRWLIWCFPPKKDFGATNLSLKGLVVCKFVGINFKDDSKAWNLIKEAQDLKVLSFTRCCGIQTIPDISRCSTLERLTLGQCARLKTIKSFIKKLGSIIELKIEGCLDFTDLPEEVGALVNLQHFSLSRCSMLRELPGSIVNLTSLTELDLTDTTIREIPRTINTLHHLQTLYLRSCHEIKELPELPTSLTCLLLHSKSLLSVPDLSKLTNLVKLLLSDDSTYSGKSNLRPKCNLRWIGNLSRLKWLQLELLEVPAPPELASLSHLEQLVLRHLNLKPLVQLPSSDWSLRNLSTLEIGPCEAEDIPLEGLPQLENLRVHHCLQLQRLSIPLELRKLRQVHVLWCQDLDEIKVVGLSKSLEILEIDYCELLTGISGLSHLKNLKTLSIRGCDRLNTVEGLNELKPLKNLDVWMYPSVESLINESCPKIPGDCVVHIPVFGKLWKNLVGLNEYFPREEELLRDTSNEIEHPFAIDFILKIKQPGGEFSVTWRKKEDVTSDSVTYEGLIAEVKGFGFLFKRMWYMDHGEYPELLIEIKSAEQVKGMVQRASKRGFIRLIVEGGVDISLEGAMVRASQVGCTDHFLVFFFCLACSLFIRLKLEFPREIGQLAGMRGFGLCEDFVVIFVSLLFLFFGFKLNWDESCRDGMNLDMVTETIQRFLGS